MIKIPFSISAVLNIMNDPFGIDSITQWQKFLPKTETFLF